MSGIHLYCTKPPSRITLIKLSCCRVIVYRSDTNEYYFLNFKKKPTPRKKSRVQGTSISNVVKSRLSSFKQSSADSAVARCPSVCLSVCRHVTKRLNISLNFHCLEAQHYTLCFKKSSPFCFSQ